MADDVTFPRFDAEAVWRELPPEAKDAIGAAALDLIAAWNAQDISLDRMELSPAGEAAEASVDAATDKLQEAAVDWLPEETWTDQGGRARIPLMLGRICRRCGCIERSDRGLRLAWVEKDLCSACVGVPAVADTPTQLAQ